MLIVVLCGVTLILQLRRDRVMKQSPKALEEAKCPSVGPRTPRWRWRRWKWRWRRWQWRWRWSWPFLVPLIDKIGINRLLQHAESKTSCNPKLTETSKPHTHHDFLLLQLKSSFFLALIWADYRHVACVFPTVTSLFVTTLQNRANPVVLVPDKLLNVKIHHGSQHHW